MFEIGSSLREARERRGLSSEDVQKAIRIRDRYLNALEEERWELLPGEAYLKGFLRTYADFLGLDGNLYVDEYNSRFAGRDDQLLVPQQLGRPGSSGGFGGLWRPLLLLALVAAVVAVAAWQLHGSGNPRPAGQNTGGTTTGQTTTQQTKHHHRAHHPTPPVSLPTRAVLSATRGACWLEVRQGSRSGALLYENTLQQGQTLPVRLTKGPLWIDIGDPPNLDIRMGGKLVSGMPTQTAAVLLTRSGLKSA
ncbi:MAG TPA: RodZ domain-containing protein [Gaiellaceae bacterium]|nr:RodZ domain-containing protein [Gaiellaceae bacterium]